MEDTDKKAKQSVVYYWLPESNKWRWCKINCWPEFRTASVVIADMRRMGYVAREGKPNDLPSKPPSKEELETIANELQ